MPTNGFKAVVRDGVVAGLSLAGWLNPRRRLRGQLTIVTFHRVLPAELRRQYPFPGLAVTPDELRWLLLYFADHFECGALTPTFRRWAARPSSDRPLLAVTFDDGQLDNYEFARPVLTEVGVPATFFIPVGPVAEAAPIWHDRVGFSVLAAYRRCSQNELRSVLGIDIPSGASSSSLADTVAQHAKGMTPDERERYVARIEEVAAQGGPPSWAGLMNWDQVRQLADEGHEIGSHSQTHALLPQCVESDLEVEIVGSKRELESRVGRSVTSFCYPNGDCDGRVLEVTRRAGYECAVTTEWGTNRPAQPAHLLRRCDMHPDHILSRRGKLWHARVGARLVGLRARA